MALTLKLGATEVLDNIFPVRGVIVTAKVGLELPTEDLQGSTLANTVGSDQTKNLPRARHGKPMELKAVGAITMGDLALQVGGKVDNGDGVKRTLLGADTATNAERLGDEGEARLGGDLDAELAAADDGARLLAFLATLARAALFPMTPS